MPLGEFRITAPRDGLSLLIFGPRDIIEAHSGVPQAAFALWDRDNGRGHSQAQRLPERRYGRIAW